MRTQQQVDSLLDNFIKQNAGKYLSYGGYRGECLSLTKLWVDYIAGEKVAPASGNGKGSGYYTIFPKPLNDYFTREKYVAGKNYPRGSMVVNAKTSHIAIFLEPGRTDASVFEQNADPDGSPAGTHQRPNSRIDGVLVVRTTKPVVSTSHKGQTVHLSKKVDSWRVYKVGSTAPRTAVAILNPKKFNGLSFKVLADDKAGVVIDTEDFGKVCLPVDSDATFTK